MKILQIGVYEFESLYKDGGDRLLYQGRTFFKGLAFTDRVYQKILKQLQQEEDDTTSCLIVEMQNSYVLWHEVTATPLTAPVKDVDLQVSQSSESTQVQETQVQEPDADLPEAEILLSTLIEQAVEKVLSQKESSLPSAVETPSPQETQQTQDLPLRPRRIYRGIAY
jgi:hypothetical protein